MAWEKMHHFSYCRKVISKGGTCMGMSETKTVTGAEGEIERSPTVEGTVAM